MSQTDLVKARIETLKKAQAVRKDESLDRVYKAIERLQKTGGKINFPTIAKEANVSVSYLYKYPELKQHIGELRNQQSSIPRKPMAQSVRSESHVKVVGRFKERIRHLEEQNRELRRKNEALAGQVYRVHYLQDQVERQQQTIEDLETRLKEAYTQLTAFKVTPINQAKTLKESLPISEVQKSGIPSRIQSELDKLGIHLNSTLTRIIKATDEEVVMDAIAALEQEMKTTEVVNLGGFLYSGIKERWVQSTPPQQQQQRQPEIYTASPEPDEEFVPLDQFKQLYGGSDE
jgi:DNA repair exonuclease SbcCD ATPase subunit